MRVDLAAQVTIFRNDISFVDMICHWQVLSSSVSKALTTVLGPVAEETAKFTAMFDKLFDCLNVSSLSAGQRKRCAFKAPYRSASDFRLKVGVIYYYLCTFLLYCLQWLQDDFLSYLDQWEDSVEKRGEFTKKQKEMMLLSSETRTGLKLTGKLLIKLSTLLNSLIKMMHYQT